jgi:hypothetical protein
MLELGLTEFRPAFSGVPAIDAMSERLTVAVTGIFWSPTWF